jgi:ethanolamine utilization protein EutP
MKMLLVGRIGTGKTTFKQAIKNELFCYKKTQAIEFFDDIIDTPGEYVENRSYYRALIVTAVEADLVILFQDCNDNTLWYAPDFAAMFGDKPVIGVVTKIDIAETKKDIDSAYSSLLQAGCSSVFMVNNLAKEGIDKVKEYMLSLS